MRPTRCWSPGIPVDVRDWLTCCGCWGCGRGCGTVSLACHRRCGWGCVRGDTDTCRGGGTGRGSGCGGIWAGGRGKGRGSGCGGIWVGAGGGRAEGALEATGRGRAGGAREATGGDRAGGALGVWGGGAAGGAQGVWSGDVAGGVLEVWGGGCSKLCGRGCGRGGPRQERERRSRSKPWGTAGGLKVLSFMLMVTTATAPDGGVGGGGLSATSSGVRTQDLQRSKTARGVSQAMGLLCAASVAHTGVRGTCRDSEQSYLKHNALHGWARPQRSPNPLRPAPHLPAGGCTQRHAAGLR